MSTTMTSLTRIRTVLAGHQPDRVPFFLALTAPAAPGSSSRY